jgi:hypothetical protein
MTYYTLNHHAQATVFFATGIHRMTILHSLSPKCLLLHTVKGIIQFNGPLKWCSYGCKAMEAPCVQGLNPEMHYNSLEISKYKSDVFILTSFPFRCFLLARLIRFSKLEPRITTCCDTDTISSLEPPA